MTTPLPSGATEVLTLWPQGVPNHPGEGLTEGVHFSQETEPPLRFIRNVQIPTLTRFPATEGRGLSALIVPGGIFHFVAIDHEGYDVARAMAAAGIDAFVLKYRVQPMPECTDDVPVFLSGLYAGLRGAEPGDITPPVGGKAVEAGRRLAEEDGRQAIRRLQEGAGRLGIDPAKLGVIGFSAGGGVAVDLALAAPSDCRPAFAAPIYPAFRPVPVPADAPPVFLATAADDSEVAPFAATRLAEAYHAAGVPVELHVYRNGGHGFGILKKGATSDGWFTQFLRWLDSLNLTESRS